MNKLPVFVISLFASFLAVPLQAAPGEVSVSLEKSPDQASWSAAATGVLNVTTPQYLRANIVPVDGGTPSSSEVVLADTTHAGKAVNVSLESSTELTTWGPASAGTHDVSGTRKFFRVQTETNFNHFVLVIPGTAGGVTISTALYISKYEVTKEEWDQVYDWAILNGYTFFNGGDPQLYAQGCDLNHPVQKVNWFDVIKWCNARSEKEGLSPVYYTNGTHVTVYRTGQLELDATAIDGSANGYRLPTVAEWEYSARGGVSTQGYVYSGSNTAADVAIYYSTADGADCDYFMGRGTFPVGTKAPNELGIYDMSGNVAEWVWSASSNLSNRDVRNGSFRNLATEIELGDGGNAIAATSLDFWGFRVAKSFIIPPPPFSARVNPSSDSSKAKVKTQKVK